MMQFFLAGSINKDSKSMGDPGSRNSIPLQVNFAGERLLGKLVKGAKGGFYRKCLKTRETNRANPLQVIHADSGKLKAFIQQCL